MLKELLLKNKGKLAIVVLLAGLSYGATQLGLEVSEIDGGLCVVAAE